MNWTHRGLAAGASESRGHLHHRGFPLCLLSVPKKNRKRAGFDLARLSLGNREGMRKGDISLVGAGPREVTRKLLWRGAPSRLCGDESQ